MIDSKANIAITVVQLVQVNQKRKNHSNISIHNQRLEDNSSVSSNSSKSSNIQHTYLYTITGQKTTRPCHPTRPSQVTFIKHFYTQSEARVQLVFVVQLVQVKSEEKHTFNHFYTQSEARGQLVHVVQLVKA